MEAAIIDTEEYVEELIEKGGAERKLASAIVRLFVRAQKAGQEEQIKAQQEVSARAVAELDSKTEKALLKLDAKIDGVEQRLDAKIDGVEQRLDAKIDLVRKEIAIARRDTIIWLGGIMFATVFSAGGLLFAVLRLLLTQH